MPAARDGAILRQYGLLSAKGKKSAVRCPMIKQNLNEILDLSMQQAVAKATLGPEAGAKLDLGRKIGTE